MKYSTSLVVNLFFILLILPSPLLKKTGDKVGDTIEGVGGEKTRDVAYKVLIDFAEGLKNSKHNGNINLTSNDQIDSELDKYKVSLDLEDLKSKEKG
ncbi:MULTISPECIES: hypothetical protein [Psychrilyobacter]|uniref:Uncharacterized protein n=1 Tax=Psychrilyobacter piezotolerans TaxID=2293438 RepID=A0ABX9KJ97_9FUSO|nr:MULTISPECIES: hypothetical protein [Psychrilyobacter]MCS5422202.1 hypothetical protein [Psychrilyobacter sp. S5]NDI77151.1 hypothetical protein [Psychrilyobacter piezotolerans]RDE64143.1 hypothetical protein DV867_04230 [Psychrilyobacter sp. S5]REI42235.1 hypothetical protein DYH56_04230 [Psychrilyobacter piezotolerans]